MFAQARRGLAGALIAGAKGRWREGSRGSLQGCVLWGRELWPDLQLSPRHGKYLWSKASSTCGGGLGPRAGLCQCLGICLNGAF